MAVLSKVKYEGDDGQVYNMRLTPDYAAAAGSEPVGGVTSDIKPKITKGNKEHGLRPRLVTLSRVIGTAPDNFTIYTSLPVLTALEWSSGAFAPGATVSIGGTAWVVVTREGEDY